MRLEPVAKNPATEAERLIALAATVPPREVDRARFDELLAVAAAPPRRDWRLVPAFAASIALGALVVSVLRPAAPPPPPPVELVASADARWTQASASVVSLSTGQLRVARPSTQPVRIETPHVVLEATLARFLAEVTSTGTTLHVDEGEVVLRAGSERRVVRAGEEVVWPPAPVIPAALLEPAVGSTEARCASAGEGRRSCLEAEAGESSLDAQAALFELGALEAQAGRSREAVAAWQRSLERFPDGVLHPEVRLRLLVELVRARRFSDAAEVAAAFEAHCADDARLADVRALAANLRARR